MTGPASPDPPLPVDLRSLVEDLVAAVDHLDLCATCSEDGLSACVRGGRDALDARERARQWLAAALQRQEPPQ